MVTVRAPLVFYAMLLLLFLAIITSSLCLGVDNIDFISAFSADGGVGLWTSFMLKPFCGVNRLIFTVPYSTFFLAVNNFLMSLISIPVVSLNRVLCKIPVSLSLGRANTSPF